MSFFEIAKKRFSVRKYEDKELNDAQILEVIEAARIAPSATNKQPWHFVVIKNKENLKKIQGCYHRDWIKSAPVIIVACGNHKNAWWRSDGKAHTDIDLAIAVDHMTLAAADLGLGTCWICKFDVMKVASLLNLPAGIEPIAMLPLGYPAESPDMNRHKNRRKKIEEIVYWERFE